MRYHYKKPKIFSQMYGEIYICNHPVYDRCTLYREDKLGLAVIQQRYDPLTKRTWWTEIDPWLTDELYLRQGFIKYFHKYAAEPVNSLYPTVTIRQIMWALEMKPIKRERWETVFDHTRI